MLLLVPILACNAGANTKRQRHNASTPTPTATANCNHTNREDWKLQRTPSRRDVSSNCNLSQALSRSRSARVARAAAFRALWSPESTTIVTLQSRTAVVFDVISDERAKIWLGTSTVDANTMMPTTHHHNTSHQHIVLLISKAPHAYHVHTSTNPPTMVPFRKRMLLAVFGAMCVDHVHVQAWSSANNSSNKKVSTNPFVRRAAGRLPSLLSLPSLPSTSKVAPVHMTSSNNSDEQDAITTKDPFKKSVQNYQQKAASSIGHGISTVLLISGILMMGTTTTMTLTPPPAYAETTPQQQTIYISGKTPQTPGSKPRDKDDTKGTRKDPNFLRSISDCKNQCLSSQSSKAKEDCLSECQDICCTTYEQCTFNIVPRI